MATAPKIDYEFFTHPGGRMRRRARLRRTPFRAICDELLAPLAPGDFTPLPPNTDWPSEMDEVDVRARTRATAYAAALSLRITISMRIDEEGTLWVARLRPEDFSEFQREREARWASEGGSQ